MKQNVITDEYIRERVSSGKKYYLRIYKTGPRRNRPEDERNGFRWSIFVICSNCGQKASW
jgi:hypothetical protein